MVNNNRRSKARTIVYAFFDEGIDSGRATLLNCEKILAKAKRDGIIIEYDDGRDRDPWFQGAPGKALRELRDVFIEAGYKNNS